MTQTTQQPAPARRAHERGLDLLVKGLRNAPDDFWCWFTDDTGVQAVKDAPGGDQRTRAVAQHRQKTSENRGIVAAVVVGTLGVLTAGALPAAIAVGAVVLLTGYAALNSKNPSWMPFGCALTGAAATLGSYWLVHAEGWPLPVIWMIATMAAAGILAWLGWDGNVFGDAKDEPKNVDEVTPDISTAGGVIAALAQPLKVTKKEDIEKAFVTVGGRELTWDAQHRWKSITIQMRGKTVDDVVKVRDRVAGGLLIPGDWFLPDKGDNESQVVMHMAESNPWPTAPTRAPILSTLTSDVWTPQRAGLDLLGSSPQEFLPVASHIAIGGDTGTGKTAFERLLALIWAADQRAILDVWDFKGDGALSVLRSVCAEFGEPDDDEDDNEFAGRFLAYLLDRKRESRRRASILREIAQENRLDARDAKLTREMAYRTDIDLRPRGILVDEFQDGVNNAKYGKEITETLVYLARKSRSGGMKLMLATQTWLKGAVPLDLVRVLSTRVSYRQPDFASHAGILGTTCRYRADQLPNVDGAAIIRPAGDGAALRDTVRLIADYVDVLDADIAVQALAQRRALAGAAPTDARPPAPGVLAQLHDLLREPSRNGRMRSVEACAALAAYGHLPALSDALDERARAQLLADVLRPLKVRPRPDRSAGNLATYWLHHTDSRGHQVGVGPAMEPFGPGERVSPGGGYRVSPPVTPGVAPALRIASSR